MKTPTRPTRRASARTTRRRGSSDVAAAPSSPSDSGASNGASAAPEGSLEVTFCAVQRVRGRSFLLLCTRSDWRLYRLDGFSPGRESCSPVQVRVFGLDRGSSRRDRLLMHPEKDAARLAGVRFFRLYEMPAAALALGALFVSERSSSLPSSDEEDDDFVSATADEVDNDDGREDISALALDEQKLLHKLPPSPSLVLDVQTNATTATVLCETRELFLYDLATFQPQQTILTASPAVALGPRWLAYPGFAQDADAGQADAREQSLSAQGDSDSDFDDVPIEALVNGGRAVEARDAAHSSSPTYSAIDVAQNVASGLYYLSEVGRATIAPYLSSSPNEMHPHQTQTSPSTNRRNSGRSRKSSLNGSTSKQLHTTAASASKKHPGWVVVLDLVTKRVLANFPCHSTALVNLSLDFSGLLLATSSTKGQNLHVYRLSPPLQSVVTKPGGASVVGHGTLHHQLVYKLQRGITHASIQDIAFSQDGKWINVTSAHGTSHLYALHPEGARISADTHANTVASAAESDADGLGPGFPLRQVNDFYADFRALETRTQTQVLRIRHELKFSTVSTVAPHKSTAPVSSKARTTRSSSTSSSSSMSSTCSSSSPPGPPFHSPPATGSMRSSTIMESALDASQALLSQLATSAIDFGHQHFENDTDVASRRRRLRQRLCCLFAPDGLKMLTCCDSVLKLHDMRVTALSQHKADHARATSSDPKTKNSKSSLSSFGFEASVTELKSWELLASGRRKSEPLGSAFEDLAGLGSSSSSGELSAKSELRTFAQRSLPLWAHPKVTFKAIDEDHPEGQILEVKRKGPNPSQDLSASTLAMAPEGYANGDEQLFVMEMDSYFGIGGSPVFNGHDGGPPTTPDVPPPLDLAASINMAMSSSLSETPPKPMPEVKNTICFRPIDQNSPPHVNGVKGTGSTQKGKKKKGKNRRAPAPQSYSETEVDASEEEGSSSGGLASLQFTMQDMYFAVPTEEASG
ncbi:Breast carcinoma amplified sequence 3 [Phytophthora pseudosyringae]|uniref:Breast carcinoma amplified sequence 3 n=1 Tax=Phytophthora pseudosyringae TaxID=221518 RepID=A0A8T1VC15_9STRA|nr:Breast carcinoma amplified sequence 3 [Phytophthora pseudosyringae]